MVWQFNRAHPGPPATTKATGTDREHLDLERVTGRQPVDAIGMAEGIIYLQGLPMAVVVLADELAC